MDANEEEVLISLRDMANSDEDFHQNGEVETGPGVTRQSSSYSAGVKVKPSLDWLALRVFYVRVSKCIIDSNSMPEYLTLNHIPLTRDTLLEVNCVRASIYSDGVSTLLKRDRLDKRSEEVTFVNTDSIRAMGSVMFEVFHENVLVLSGTLEFPSNNGIVGEFKYRSWSMNCESDTLARTGVFKANPNLCTGQESGTSPSIEVYVAGSFLGSPIVLSQTLLVNPRRKTLRKGGMLESIPEYEPTQNQEHHSMMVPAQLRECQQYKPQEDAHCSSPYSGTEYLENEDGEISWFNAGVRVGVGIGLSICLGVGIGVGLLVRTYQGTTRNFRRRVL